MLWSLGVGQGADVVISAEGEAAHEKRTKTRCA